MIFLLFVICAAIVAFFSQEIIALIKWVFSIPGSRLCLPLLFVSWVVESYAIWLYYGLAYIQTYFLALESYCASFFPHFLNFIPRVLLLTLLALLPQLASSLVCRLLRQKSCLVIGYPYRLASVFVWIAFVVMVYFSPNSLAPYG